jgi:hypothetical protein
MHRSPHRHRAPALVAGQLSALWRAAAPAAATAGTLDQFANAGTAIALPWRLIDTSACVPDRSGVANAERRRGSRANCGAGEVVACIA